MSCAEGLATFGIVLLNGHVGIPKTNNFFFTLVASFYNRLLTTRNLAFRFVALHLRLVDLSHKFYADIV